MEEEIKRLRELSFAALKRKDINEYLNIFSEDLKYTQLNGKTIGKKQLTNNTKSYFNRVHSVFTKYEVISKEFNEEEYIEELTQETSVLIRGFIFLLFEWKVNRKAIYTWQNIKNNWRITSVKVLSEKTNLGRRIKFYYSASEFSRTDKL
jgi:hypothetical protein